MFSRCRELLSRMTVAASALKLPKTRAITAAERSVPSNRVADTYIKPVSCLHAGKHAKASSNGDVASFCWPLNL